ncbi:Predicted P-loop ATPase, KAP-like [Halorubrum ezzemoulense]|uniref:Predicted P-loop ATPase, KAP-like n=1 Tax=Halorubrum ezzemoulense TaxID=337243 RepID=A0A238Y350_HALEZ|nr:P-loop NTPase fold protein [Halorubrum ezzemoulense]SNR65706.1 Predicted P-loop ATPase, KAP-like [Halorubrum ezzemoulense]
MQFEESELQADSELENPEHDQLGYSDFSQNLADIIHSRIPTNEFIIGIYGQWGSGKSTILNFIEYELKQKEDPPLITWFNPWWFSGQSDLIEKFFAQLEAGLDTGDEYDELRDNLSKLADGLSRVPLSTITGIPSGKLLAWASDTIQSETPDLEGLKEQISNALRELDQQIVVFIDDIDRLTESEIRQMFRLVKAVADFPNITYVLAFDQEVVINSLDGEQGGGNGREYLHKIIQLPQHVPIPAEDSLNHFFTERLEGIVQDDDVIFDESTWQSVYQRGIQPLIHTPRDAVRLANAVNSSYQALGRDANFIDIVGLEALHIFHDPAYEKVRSNPSRYTANIRSDRNLGDEEYSELWEHLDEGAQDIEPLQVLLRYLFPETQTGSLTLGFQFSRDYDTYRKRRRVCHPEVFPYYFRQTIPKGELPVGEIESVLRLTDDVNKFAKRLQKLASRDTESDRSMAHTFLSQLSSYTDEIRDKEKVVKGFLVAGDELIKADPSRNALDDGNRGYLLRLTFELLDSRTKERNFKLLCEAIRQGDSPYFATYLLGVLLQEHGEYGSDKIEEGERKLDREQLEELKQEVVSLIEERASKSTLLQTPNLYLVLQRWNEWADSEMPTQWTKELIEDNEGLFTFVRIFVKEGSYSAAGSPQRTVEYIDPKDIEPFLDTSEIERRFEALDQKELNNSDQELIELFEQGQTLIDEGKDPSSLETWVFGEQR